MCGEGRGENERAAEFAAILEGFIRFRKRKAIERRDRAEPLGHIVLQCQHAHDFARLTA
jgi:hypothetical protein